MINAVCEEAKLKRVCRMRGIRLYIQCWFKILNFFARVNVIKKRTNKFDWLVNEMLCIQDLKPALNVQSDSPHAKVFM